MIRFYIYLLFFYFTFDPCHSKFTTDKFTRFVPKFATNPLVNIKFIEAFLATPNNSAHCALKCSQHTTCLMSCYLAGKCLLGKLKQSFKSGKSKVAKNANTCLYRQMPHNLTTEEIISITGLQNVALNKPTSVSTVHRDHYGNLSVDGILPSLQWDYPNTCMHTSDDLNLNDQFPYLMVDLVETYLAFAFNITNRMDTPELLKRLHDFEVRVGYMPHNSITNSMFQQNQLCHGFYDVAEGMLNILRNCETPVDGRYLSVQIIKSCIKAKHSNCLGDGLMNVLTICELQVFALLIT